MRNNLFCKRNTTSTITSSLNANAPTIDKEAYLEVEEAVSRTKEPYPVEVKLSYTQTTRTTWKYSGVSSILKLPGVKSSTNIEIPIIVDDNKVKIGFPGAVQFGETETLWEVVYKVVLQAMTRVKVKYVAAEASFNTQTRHTFGDSKSRAQRDTLMSGEIISSNIDDAVYTGVNTFDFKCHSTEKL
ncbi:unnamed protein product [Malus baccata var. baccata]